MKQAKRERLSASGWRVGSAADFLSLSPEEAAFVELKLSLSESLRAYRNALGMTQIELAKRLRSSQSRVAKMEAGDPSVSADLLLRSLLAVGARRPEIARAITRKRLRRGVSLSS